MTPTSSWTTRAVAHVAAAASDGAVDRSLRVTLDFHPDRVLDGMRVLECLARDGVYRSQFETGTSNGGLTAHPGGDRWRWEQRIFGHAYDDRAASQVRRPEPSSAADRRCTTLRVRPSPTESQSWTAARSASPDSTFEPTAMGTAERFDLIQLADATNDGQVHGVRWTTTSRPTSTARSGWTATSKRSCWTRASGAQRSRTRHTRWASRSSGTRAAVDDRRARAAPGFPRTPDRRGGQEDRRSRRPGRRGHRPCRTPPRRGPAGPHEGLALRRSTRSPCPSVTPRLPDRKSVV